MAEQQLSEPYILTAVEDYRRQAREFLSRAREYLAQDDLHQASEKGWGSAAWMAKAVAVTQGWEYNQHAHFGVVLQNVSDATGDDRFRALRAVAFELHQNFYTRKRFLSDRAIGLSLDNMAQLMDALEPLVASTNTNSGD